MDPKFVVSLSGRDYPLYAGILAEAHERGLQSIETQLIQVPGEENGHTAIVKAVVRLKDGSYFEDYGDANPRNTSARVATALIRMASCVPLSSEILTRSGFKRHDQLVIGEEVLAYDLETDTCRWTPLLAVNVFEDPHPTVRFSSRSCSFVCTPDHSWVVTGQRTGTRLQRSVRPRLIKLHAFKRGQHIIQAATAESGSSAVSPREAAILGWLATDGNVRESMVTDRYGTFGPYLRATIYQSKPQYISVLRELLGEDASELTEKPRDRDFRAYGGRVSQCKESHRWQLKTSFVRKLYRNAEIERLEELPDLVLRLSAPARAAMLEAMLQAEGHHKGGGRWVFYQRKAWVIEAFVLLATLEGRALGASTGKGVRWDQRALRSNRYLTVEYLLVEPEGDQPVWCPTTRYGTWVMRQEGMVSITGNTRAKGRALRDAINVGQTMLEELPDLEEQGTPEPRGAAVVYRAEPQPRAVIAEPPAQAAAEALSPAPAAAANGSARSICSTPGCGKALTKGQFDVSTQRFGQPLCPSCQKSHVKAG
jgi:hypothetical protein